MYVSDAPTKQRTDVEKNPEKSNYLMFVCEINSNG